MTMDNTAPVFIVKSGGHWGPRGWTYSEERTFASARQAHLWHQQAEAPKKIGVLYANGFRATLSECGLRSYLRQEGAEDNATGGAWQQLELF